jgi:hypothetical protein
MVRYKDTDYFVTENGKVYKNGKQLKSHITKKGYERVSLYLNKKIKKYFVHRLVGDIYLDNPNSLPFINHKNYVRNDNSVNNLEWVTLTQNNRDRGVFTKLDIGKVKEIRTMNKKQKDIAEMFNITQSNVSQIKTNKIWNNGIS